MFKKTLMTAAAALAITAGATTISTPDANAGGHYGYYGGRGSVWGYGNGPFYGYGNPKCYKYWKKYNHTGNYYWKKKFYKCKEKYG